MAQPIRCSVCAAFISPYDARGGAKIAGLPYESGARAICPTCAVTERPEGTEQKDERSEETC